MTVRNRALSGYLFNLIYDLGPARLRRGGRWVLSRGCPRRLSVTLIGVRPPVTAAGSTSDHLSDAPGAKISIVVSY